MCVKERDRDRWRDRDIERACVYIMYACVICVLLKNYFDNVVNINSQDFHQLSKVFPTFTTFNNRFILLSWELSILSKVQNAF